ncbi:MAG: flippase-like domain-containing protein [Chloroflexi bacterium]|nr:flippase-like domain-containing protein [Chloroflexota bacterium]MBU1751426.1 flippase-like domain-containing protein [Chloroflexota bacterium]
MRHIRDRWQFWLGISISLILAALALVSVDLNEVLAALRQMNVWYLVPAALFVVISQVARAYRWQLLFYPRQGLRLTKLFNIMNIGYLLNSVLPARAGDLARPVLLNQVQGTSVAGGFSTILVERLLDTFTVVLLLFALLPFVPVSPEVQSGGIMIAIALIALTVFLVVLSFQRALGHRLLHWLAGRISLLDRPAIYQAYDAVIDSLAVLRSPWPGVGVLGWTAAIWVLAILQDYAVLLAFDSTLPPTAAVLVLCFTGLSMIIPASPGAIGTFHWAAIVALGVFGIAYSPALTIAVTLHAFSFGLVCIIGLACMWAESLSYSDIKRRITQTTEEQHD